MILFFILLSSIASCALTWYFNKLLVIKYPKYKSNYIRHMMCLSIIINLILQSKFLHRTNEFSNLSYTQGISIIIIAGLLLLTIVSASLAVSFVIDCLYFELPDELNLLICIALIPVSVLLYSGKSIITGIAIFVIYFLIAIFTDSFGMGDAKLVLGLGMVIKLPLLIKFMFISFLFASIYSIFKMVVFKQDKKSEIAFGPFIVLSFLLMF